MYFYYMLHNVTLEIKYIYFIISTYFTRYQEKTVMNDVYNLSRKLTCSKKPTWQEGQLKFNIEK